MRYLILLLAIVSSIFYSCNTGTDTATDPYEDSLMNANRDLSGQVSQKDSAIYGFIRSFNEIQENLDLIKEKEKLLTKSGEGGELSPDQKEQIIADIQAIYELMANNKNKLNSANKKLKKANLRIAELEKMIERLNTQIAEKDVEIAELKRELEKMDIELSEVTLNYEASQLMLEGATEKLQKAWYAFGTSKELIQQGVLTKEGGFIGIGKAEKLKDDFNKGYFTQINITETTSITLASKEAKIVTSHPAGSFKIEGSDGKAEKLVITNPEEFWSVSKYLVIVVN